MVIKFGSIILLFQLLFYVISIEELKIHGSLYEELGEYITTKSLILAIFVIIWITLHGN